MNFANIRLGSNVEIDPSSTFNNVTINDGVRIAKRCSIYGGPKNVLEIGKNSYVGMNTVLNGFAAKLTIGENVSISQFVNIMVDSGPNASPGMQKVFPLEKGPITIGNDSWIGASVIIMPNVTLGEYCVVASNSFVNKSFPSFSIIGGSPARLLRSFTSEEKEKMLNKEENAEHTHYEKNYIDLPFEDVLRKYREKNILDIIKRFPHGKFLEIGCGADPLFQLFTSFDKMVVIEPSKTFFDIAQSLAEKNKKVLVINDLFENVIDKVRNETFDFIVIGGFLHEINNPHIVLQELHKLCSKETVIYSYVPNAKSFHRLLAYKMEIIENIYVKSGHDELFNRHNVYDIDSFNELMISNNFKVIESGSYFLKPFTHDQMVEMINLNIINKTCLDGLGKMIDFIPDMGTEIWNICKIND